MRAIYTPIFDGFFEGSIMLEEVETRFFFLFMLRLASRPGADGVVDIPLPMLAAQARMPEEAVRRALDALMRPDPLSGSEDEEGRRLVPLNAARPDRGWRVVNFGRYHNELHLANDAARKKRERAEREKAQNEPRPPKKPGPKRKPDASRNVPKRPRVSRNVPKRPGASRDGATRRDDTRRDDTIRKEKRRRGEERVAFGATSSAPPPSEGKGPAKGTPAPEPPYEDHSMRLEDGTRWAVPLPVVTQFKDRLDEDELDREVVKLCRLTAVPSERPKTPNGARQKLLRWLRQAVAYKERDEADGTDGASE